MIDNPPNIPGKKYNTPIPATAALLMETKDNGMSISANLRRRNMRANLDTATDIMKLNPES